MLSHYFQFSKNQTNLRTELLAGVTSFLACAYIIVVNPAILSQSGMPFSAVLTGTVLISAFSSILMGIYAKNPIIVAPGMGINAYFTYTLVLGMKVPVPTALGAVFWSGVIFLLLSIFNLRSLMARAIPRNIRLAVAGGIGLFIALIGLSSGGIVIDHPVTLLTKGPLNPKALCFFAGLLITSILLIKKIPGALILGVGLTALIAAGMGRWYAFDLPPLVEYKGIFATPDFSLIGQLDLKNSLSYSLLPVIFSFLYTDMFDSLSTFMGLAEAGKLHDESGEVRHLNRSLLVDALATVISGPLGTSSGTSFIESVSGIEQGGRTGLTAIVAGLCFLPFMFFSPLLSLIPHLATAPLLVLMGVFMIAPLAQIKWDHLEESIPCFLAFALIPLTYSISHGIMWGILSYTALKMIQGKFRQIPWPLWAINLFSLASLLL